MVRSCKAIRYPQLYPKREICQGSFLVLQVRETPRGMPVVCVVRSTSCFIHTTIQLESNPFDLSVYAAPQSEYSVLHEENSPVLHQLSLMQICCPCYKGKHNTKPLIASSMCVGGVIPLGKPAELQRKESTERHPFQHGDKVKCLLDIDILREMQEGHGGWNPKMAEVCCCSFSFSQHCRSNHWLGSCLNIFV